MNQIKNSAPQILFWGFDDQSGRIVPSVPEQVPIHLPFMYFYGRKGKTTPRLAAGKALNSLFGSESFDPRGPYATHATPFINGFNEAANIMLLQRLRPAGAKTASLQLGIEVLPMEVPVYERNVDGSYKLDAVTSQPIDTGATIPGHKCAWVVKEVAGDIGTSTVEVGTLVDELVQSNYYPIIDLSASSFGAWGSDTGIRLYPRYNTGLTPVDEELVSSQEAFVYGLQVMSRADAKSTANVWKTLSGSQSVDFMFKPDTYNGDMEMHWDARIIPAWTDADGGEEGPFEHAYLYQENITTVLTALASREAGLGEFPAVGGEHLMNFVGGRDVDGNPYQSVLVLGINDGGVELTANSTYYQLGGDDGQMGNEAYDTDVANQLANFNELDYLYEDMAKYPLSAFYDTGFKLETKKLIPRILGICPAAHVALATQDVNKRPNTTEEDSSIGISLRAAIAAFPESIMYGTGAARGVVVGHSGKALGSTYNKMVPGTYELAMKRARYFGAGNGIMKSRWAYDQGDMKTIQYMKDVTGIDKPQKVRNKDWANGLIYFQNYDTSRAFMPMGRTVYKDDTSVLTSEMVMQIATNCNRVAFEVWRELVGNGKLNDAQFIQRSNRRITELTNGRYDGRVVIVPETYYTPEDEARGYSWSCRIHVYAPNTKTVSATTVVTHRLSDLTA